MIIKVGHIFIQLNIIILHTIIMLERSETANTLPKPYTKEEMKRYEYNVEGHINRQLLMQRPRRPRRQYGSKNCKCSCSRCFENDCCSYTMCAQCMTPSRVFFIQTPVLYLISEIPKSTVSTKRTTTKSTTTTTTEEPSTEEPSTEEPSTEEPSTEEPSTEEPSESSEETTTQRTKKLTDKSTVPPSPIRKPFLDCDGPNCPNRRSPPNHYGNFRRWHFSRKPEHGVKLRPTIPWNQRNTKKPYPYHIQRANYRYTMTKPDVYDIANDLEEYAWIADYRHHHNQL